MNEFLSKIDIYLENDVIWIATISIIILLVIFVNLNDLNNRLRKLEGRK